MTSIIRTRSLALVAVAAVSFAGALSAAHAQSAGPVQLALAAPADEVVRAEAARPLAVMLDQPSGGRFVYLPEQGWTFAGSQADAAEAATVAAAGQPVSVFIDQPTGFVFTYKVEEGWVFAGTLGKAD
ncbi:hypothetical protein [Thauera sp.]|uniref:hypothetical protein n=1 Tax=Thauera sp. TaxID=1905334 RepID=UPI002C51EACD|nr:hypothetical protein [Thauera sp.]HRP24538.1 hypothetical protein [Thauera sp.]